MDFRIINDIEILKDFINKTKKLHNHNKSEFLEDEKTHYSVSMTLFTILNQSIEIGEELIELNKLKPPLTYREIFKILYENKIISYEVYEKLSTYMKNRNMIAHQYGTFEILEIYEIAENIEIFEKYLKEIQRFLNKNN